MSARRPGRLAWVVAVTIAGLLVASGPRREPASASTEPIAANLACPPSVTSCAEGSTRGGIDTLLTLLNPSDADAIGLIDFAIDDGSHLQTRAAVPAHTRTNIDVNAFVPSEHDVATTVTLAGGRQLVAERVVYLARAVGAAGPVVGGTVGSGATAARSQWLFAEGSTRAGIQT